MGLTIRIDDVRHSLSTNVNKLGYGFVVLMLILTFLQLSSYRQYQHDWQNVSQEKPVSSKMTTSNTTQLFRSSLFGQYIPKEDASIQASTLNLEVVGIMYNVTPSKSLVTIKDTQGKEETYHTGDKLSGAEIKKITPTEVIVLYHGVLEKLSLPNQTLTFEPIAPSLFEDKP